MINLGLKVDRGRTDAHDCGANCLEMPTKACEVRAALLSSSLCTLVNATSCSCTMLFTIVWRAARPVRR